MNFHEHFESERQAIIASKSIQRLESLQQTLNATKLNNFDLESKSKILNELRLTLNQRKEVKFKFKKTGGTTKAAVVSAPIVVEPTAVSGKLIQQNGDGIVLNNYAYSILILESATSILLSNLKNCVIYAKTNQLRFKECTDCRVYPDSQSLIIETCSGMAFGSLNGAEVNVVDFNWLKNSKSPHYSLIEASAIPSDNELPQILEDLQKENLKN